MRPAEDPLARWRDHIAKASTSDRLDKIYEGLGKAGLDGDSELLTLLSQRDSEIRGDAAVVG